MATKRKKAASRSERVLLAAVAIAALAILLARLGAAPLIDIDEGAFTESSREMLASGNWFAPSLYGAALFDVPAFAHWWQMPSLRFVGLDALGARLPSAIAGVGWVVAISAWAWALAGRDLVAAAFGASIATTAIAVPLTARLATPDAVAGVWMALVLLMAWHALFTRQESDARRYARIGATALALGMMTQGPVALLVPAITVPLATWWAARGRRLAALLGDPIAWAIAVLFPLPWLLMQWRAQGNAFIDGFFWRHHLGRFLEPIEGTARGFGFFPIVLLLALLPWTPLFVRALIGVVREPGHLLRDRGFGLTWMPLLLVFAFFSFSATKEPQYLLPGIGGLLAMLGAAATQASRESLRFGWERGLCAVMLLALATLPWWLPTAAAQLAVPYYRQGLRDALVVLSGQWIWLVGLGVGGLAVLALAPTREAVLGGATVFALMLHLIAVPAVADAFQAPIVAAGERVAAVRGRVITWRFDMPSLSIAARRPVPPGQPALGDTVVLRIDRRDALATALARAMPRGELRMRWRMGGVEVAEVVAAR